MIRQAWGALVRNFATRSSGRRWSTLLHQRLLTQLQVIVGEGIRVATVKLVNGTIAYLQQPR